MVVGSSGSSGSIGSSGSSGSSGSTETQVSYCHTSSRAPLQRNVHFIIVSSFCFSKVQRFSST